MKIKFLALVSLVICLILIVVLLGMSPTLLGNQQAAAKSPSAQGSQASVSSPIPVLAYYYIWYDTSSWDRAKIDYPLLGR